LGRALTKVEALGVAYRILFLEASTGSIVRRYKETRRRHPLDPDSLNVAAAVEKERSLLSVLRGRADAIIDTTDLTLAGLSNRIKTLYGNSDEDTFSVNLRSFGFKYAALTDADIVFDVRFLPNPYYVRELAPLTGLDGEVRDYVMDDPLTEQFMYKFKDFLQFLIPHYAAEGKHALNVAIGCTGGRHRSVAIAAALSEFAAELGYKTSCLHRDIDR
jgi:UPF0042 nucleotide-binding protein